ncbi:MAG TPA: flagellar hook-associated protein FlgK, partial [Acidimicrobiales bacterium]|nr:flagellar hook-associated protein FlgK [Acidimicrobiales bacterium]
VSVTSVSRLDNAFLRQRSYSEQSSQGMLQAQQSGLQGVQQNFPEPSTNGLSGALTQFWQGWSTLANNPADIPTRAMLVQQGQNLASQLNQTSTSLNTLSEQTAQNISLSVAQVNQDATQIANLNQSIIGASAGGGSAANELIDQRDQIISQLSNVVGLSVSQGANNTVNVTVGGEPLVAGVNYQQLSLSKSGPPYSLTWSQDQSTFQPQSGQLAGMLDVVNNYVPTYQAGLDQVAHSLMGSVNYLMSTGYDLNGNKGAPFFTGTGAADIQVNPAVASDPSLIAAASAPVPAGSTATNQDGTIAADVGELPNSQTATLAEPTSGWSAGGTASAWSGATSSTGQEADAAYNQLVTAIGQATSTVNTNYANQQAVTTNVNSALQSTTGVNTDQELTNMVMFQNAYDASAKFISTVNTTLQTLVSMVNG